ncbi:hypothetical protein FISHEDRAFT_39656 [Fistulina hepatica ATCC 64428]|uniref:NEDD8-activating enzyme E1 regulatory subunit n=1 Tax=Fistulina hepatica ATCC 64428 TaxID=1128425 RepID=A0A0D7AFW2_9AGAR|nr:hypothetical protein FISHEDRAFT_39656 [Fistulina hepatica ATCC 64428]
MTTSIVDVEYTAFFLADDFILTWSTFRSGQPDTKTRRYDRQLRLWAASGQAALENARVLVISATATATSTLKNLVLPGVGHFTILDHRSVSPADVGNNFFLEGFSSLGKPRAQEAVRLLCELNDGVEGRADTSGLVGILVSDPFFLTTFDVVIAHNLPLVEFNALASILWNSKSKRHPTLAVVRSAGFIAEFYLQFREHAIIESHSDTAPSLRVDKPFPALLEYATSLDFDAMDSTDHAHIPYVVILVRALADWKAAHGGAAPKTYTEKNEFKAILRTMKKKFDEENFDEAEAQAYRCWTDSGIPSSVVALFRDPRLERLTWESHDTFFHLVAALDKFTQEPPYTLPLSSTLPDMKANTTSYIHLQNMYKKAAEEDKARFKSYLKVAVDDATVDLFVKNCHAIQLLKGRKWGELDRDPQALAKILAENPEGKELATHLALSALAMYEDKHQREQIQPTVEDLTAEAQGLLPAGVALPEAFGAAVGEVVRSPTADLPNTAAFLGGLVAQEVIKMITKQYVPINGYCVVDMVDMWTGIVPSS